MHVSSHPDWTTLRERLRTPLSQRLSSAARRRLDADLTAVCLLYARADAAQRRDIRDLFGRSPALGRHLLDLAARLCRFGVSEGASWLELALAALSIENLRMGEHDTLVLLGELHFEALREGLDPRPYLLRAADCSSERPEHAARALRDVLSGFESSAYLQQELAARRPAGRHAVAHDGT